MFKLTIGENAVFLDDYSSPRKTNQLIRHEGLRLKPYHCPAGRLTIGVGRNLEDNGITENEAVMLLENDVRSASQKGWKIPKKQLYE